VVVALALLAGVSHATVPPHAPQIALLIGGRLRVLSVRGGQPHLASSAEKAAWKAAPRRYAPTSPDGTYRVDVVHDEENGTEGFRVVRTDDGREIVSLETLMRATGTDQKIDLRLMFQGWLSDARHIAVDRHYHIAGMETDDRCVVEVPGGKAIAFTGWAAPGSHFGIAPLKERRVHQEAIASDDRRSWRISYAPLAVVALPADLSSFRLRAARKAPLTVGGKPLHLALDQFVEFSRDGRWAIANVPYGERGSYLISLDTGRARRLGGSQASFLPTD